MANKQDKIVSKHNSLLDDFIKLDLQEKRFLDYAISEIDTLNDTEFCKSSIPLSHLAEVFDIPKTYVYERMKDAAISINSHPILSTDGSKKITFWFKEIDIDTAGTVVVEFNERLKPLLLDLKNNFTSHRRSITEGLNGTSWTLYLLMKQYQKAGSRKMCLEELVDKLSLGKSYKRINNLKSVIDKNIRKINCKTDIRVSYVDCKSGRKITGLYFKIQQAPRKKADIEIESPKDYIKGQLTVAGIKIKTIDDLLSLGDQRNKLTKLSNEIDGIINASKAPKVDKKTGYIVNSIKAIIGQQELFKKPIDKGRPTLFDFSKYDDNTLKDLASTGNKMAKNELGKRVKE